MAEVDARLLGKPSIWHGDEASWEEWNFILKAYFCLINDHYVECLDQAAAAVSLLSLPEFGPATVPMAKKLRLSLAMVLRGPPLMLLRSCEAGCGF